jgi:hypothetical protein
VTASPTAWQPHARVALRHGRGGLDGSAGLQERQGGEERIPTSAVVTRRVRRHPGRPVGQAALVDPDGGRITRSCQDCVSSWVRWLSADARSTSSRPHARSASVRLTPFVPLTELLPLVDVYVTNGGYGGVQMVLAQRRSAGGGRADRGQDGGLDPVTAPASRCGPTRLPHGRSGTASPRCRPHRRSGRGRGLGSCRT